MANKRRPTKTPTGNHPALLLPARKQNANPVQASTSILRFQRAAPDWLAAALIVVAGVIAYSNSLRSPFIFDDEINIVKNASIRRLWPLSDVLLVRSVPAVGLYGRPVVNLSLALNYAAGDLEPVSYHWTNLIIHLLAGLTLFGIVRRTLILPVLAPRFGRAATWLALIAALLWTVHPIQTESVTYLIQRCESLMGFLFLLAMYATLRSATSPKPQWWATLTIIAALLALGSKEVAVSLPLCILLYDRAFLAGSFREAWRQRRGMYLGLMVVWTAFVVFQIYAPARGESVGSNAKVSVGEYALSQPGVILHYLYLSIWPRPLVFDYSWLFAGSPGQILPGVIVVGGFLAATLYALIRQPMWGFLGAWFFLILAPTSSVLPIRDLAFEHRMYLPLAAVVTAVVIGAYLIVEHFYPIAQLSTRAAWVACGGAACVAALTLATLTWQRNEDYQSELSIWRDTVDKVPNNARAQENFARALFQGGDVPGAIEHFQISLELDPSNAEAHNKLGATLAFSGDLIAAEAQYLKALEINPDYAEVYNNLGDLARKRGDPQAAVSHYQKALAIKADYADAHSNLGNILVSRGETSAAVVHFKRALELQPDLAEPYNNLGAVLFGRGELSAAIAHFRKALALKPDYPLAQKNLDVALARQRKGTTPLHNPLP